MEWIVAIKSYPTDLAFGLMHLAGRDRVAELKKAVRTVLDTYTTRLVTVSSDTDLAEDIAEEVFDLTNNPARDDERVKVFGRHRSVSVGDVLEIKGVNYVCAPVGWVMLDA